MLALLFAASAGGPPVATLPASVNWLANGGPFLQQLRSKRTAEDRYFDIDCSRILAPSETIVSVTSVTSDQGGLVFGAPAVNGVQFAYPDGRIAAPNKVVQVEISGGSIPSPRPWLLCYVRALLSTSRNPAVEAIVALRLIDNPGVPL